MTPRARRLIGGVGVAAAVGILVTLAYTMTVHVGDVLWMTFSQMGLLMLALSAFLLVTGLRFLRGATTDADDHAAAGGAPPAPASAEAPRPVAPVPVPPEELELEEMSVVACLRCGSVKVVPLTMSDGLFVMGGETLHWVCRRCNWRGAPLTFDDPTAYRAFVKGLHEEAAAETVTVLRDGPGGPGKASGEPGP